MSTLFALFPSLSVVFNPLVSFSLNFKFMIFLDMYIDTHTSCCVHLVLLYLGLDSSLGADSPSLGNHELSVSLGVESCEMSVASIRITQILILSSVHLNQHEAMLVLLVISPFWTHSPSKACTLLSCLPCNFLSAVFAGVPSSFPDT